MKTRRRPTGWGWPEAVYVTVLAVVAVSGWFAAAVVVRACLSAMCLVAATWFLAYREARRAEQRRADQGRVQTRARHWLN